MKIRLAVVVVLSLSLSCAHRERSPSAASRDVEASPSSEGQGSSESEGKLTAGIWDDNLNFERFSAYRDSVKEQGKPELSPEEQARARDAAIEALRPKSVLDIALVIDTTGSMGDEMEYLKTELTSISRRISTQFPESKQRWSIIVYRDEGDDYVVRANKFSGDIGKVSEILNAQSAGGGGDFPEAPDKALAAASQLDWRSGVETARLVFWVADARHHEEKSKQMAESLRALRDSSVKIFPIASSGIDELTEYTMRAAAQLTGGRYLFLTDDSGIGGAHKEPTMPCYEVSKLSDAMVRMVTTELTGVRTVADRSTILRTVGKPEDGVCRFPDGSVAALF